MLLNEPPLQVLPTLAVLVGLKQAIVLQQLQYWLNNKDKRHKPFIRNDRRWVHNTYEEWQAENFPFWSVSTVRRTFADAESSGLVMSEQFDLPSGDPRKYYTINYEKLESLVNPSDQDEQNPSVQNEHKPSVQPEQNPSVQDEQPPLPNLNRPPVQSEQTSSSDWAEHEEAETYSETSSETSSEKEALSLSASNIFQEVFGRELAIFQQEQLGVVTDLTVWKRTLSDWKTNLYSERNLAGMIQSYRENVVKPVNLNGFAKSNSWAYVGAHHEPVPSSSADSYREAIEHHNRQEEQEEQWLSELPPEERRRMFEFAEKELYRKLNFSQRSNPDWRQVYEGAIRRRVLNEFFYGDGDSDRWRDVAEIVPAKAAPVERCGSLGRVLDVLDGLLSEVSVCTWFEPLREVRVEDCVIYLAAPNQVFRNMIEANYAEQFYTAVQRAGFAGVVFVEGVVGEMEEAA